MEELINCISHAGPVFSNENKTVFVMITKAVAATFIDSTIKYYSRRKYSRAVFLALIANHTVDTKYRAIVKSRINLLRNIKWNGQN